MAKNDFKFSGGGFKASSIPAPKFGSSSNPSEQFQMWLQKQIYDQSQKKQERSNIGQDIETVKSQFGGNIPAGTKATIGDVSVPLNRELNVDETSAITANNVFSPIADEIKTMTNEGAFDAQYFKGVPLAQNIERTYRQYAAGQPNAVMTSFDPNLQAIQGKISSLRRYVFGEGGKQLTPYEANIVNALIKPTGKSNEQYNVDLDEAIKMIQEKSRLAQGGSLAATSPIPGMNNQNNQNSVIEQERQKAIAAIQAGKDAKKIADIFRSRTGQELNG